MPIVSRDSRMPTTDMKRGDGCGRIKYIRRIYRDKRFTASYDRGHTRTRTHAHTHIIAVICRTSSNCSNCSRNSSSNSSNCSRSSSSNSCSSRCQTGRPVRPAPTSIMMSADTPGLQLRSFIVHWTNELSHDEFDYLPSIRRFAHIYPRPLPIVLQKLTIIRKIKHVKNVSWCYCNAMRKFPSDSTNQLSINSSDGSTSVLTIAQKKETFCSKCSLLYIELESTPRLALRMNIVDSESALRSTGTLLSRIRVPPPAPWPDGEPESLRILFCGLAVYKSQLHS
ncbi:hypothetical protein PoB_000432300 [Plakobranchus ocellatus]|uniref:Uncharacterized protein n=1 Tax=Plakobranchus ocellatus TaxID=259542 RepID=A0AAV3Y5W4_9GAST|nr:hypothetical protein PoB_000432300 [Plakobranchus ocellatus]